MCFGIFTTKWKQRLLTLLSIESKKSSALNPKCDADDFFFSIQVLKFKILHLHGNISLNVGLNSNGSRN